MVFLLPHIKLAQIISESLRARDLSLPESSGDKIAGLLDFQYSVPVEFERLLKRHRSYQELRAAMIRYTPFGGRDYEILPYTSQDDDDF